MLTPRMVPGIVRKKRQGFTIEGMAAAYGVSPALMRQAIMQRTRADKIRQLISDRNFSIRELAKLGNTPNAIGKAFGMEAETVRKIIQPKGRASGGKVRGQNNGSN